MQFTKAQILNEAEIIYDAVCDSAMERGESLPWWSELPEESIQGYLDRAKRKLQRKAEIKEKLDSIPKSLIAEYLQESGYEVYEAD